MLGSVAETSRIILISVSNQSALISASQLETVRPWLLLRLQLKETTSYQKMASDSHCQTNLSPDYSSLFEICSSPLQQRAKCDPHPPQVIGHPLVSYGSGYFTIRGDLSTRDVLPLGAPNDPAKSIAPESFDQECLNSKIDNPFIHDGFFFCAKPRPCSYDFGGPVFKKMGEKFFSFR